jgi:hypothetical protein
MWNDDEEYTDPMVVVEELRLARGTRRSLTRVTPPFVSGDWLVSPTGVEGYLAGRSYENPGTWLFVIKTGPGSWDGTVVEMLPEHFEGFRLKEKTS